MVKVTEVHYERLFSLEKYHNEKIGFSAAIGKDESADKILSELFFKIAEVEDALQGYRGLEQEIIHMEHNVRSSEATIASREEQIENMKHTIDELLAKGEQGDVDARLRHACETQSYKGLQEDLAKQKIELEEREKKLTALIKSKAELQKRIKEGNFSLEGLELLQPTYWSEY